PSAGPAITPTWPPTPRSAIAPAICSSGTISRVMARAAGFPTTLAQPATAASTRNGQSERAPASVTKTSATAIEIVRTYDAAVTARRGSRSAICPAGSASTGSGRNSIRPTSPRSTRFRWIASTCHSIATASICDARPFVTSDAKRRAKSRMRSAGGRRCSTVGRLGSRPVSDTHETTQAKLEWLRELREEALHAGSERAVARRREEGRLLARERAEKLCDPGSFVELDRYVRHRESNFGMMERRPYGDAVVTGYGTVFGRKVFLFSQDFTVFGGSLSEVFAEKIC